MPAVNVAELRARAAFVRLVEGKRPPRRVRPLKVKPATTVGARYRAQLLVVLAEIWSVIDDALRPVLEGATAAALEERPRVDAPADDARDAFRRIRERLGSRTLGRESLDRMAREVGNQVAAWNRGQVDRQMRSGIGVGLPTLEPSVLTAVRAFAADNASLIESLGARTVRDVERVVFNGFRRGLRFETIAQQIQERRSVSRSRAELIARDQVASLNAELTQLRQVSMGVTRYRWRTVGDERVRDEHEEREGEIFEWSDPPEDGHPGEPINCRCSAEPVLEDVLAQLEAAE